MKNIIDNKTVKKLERKNKFKAFWFNFKIRKVKKYLRKKALKAMAGAYSSSKLTDEFYVPIYELKMDIDTVMFIFSKLEAENQLIFSKAKNIDDCLIVQLKLQENGAQKAKTKPQSTIPLRPDKSPKRTTKSTYTPEQKIDSQTSLFDN